MILVTGGNGQLGNCLRKILSPQKAIFTDIAELDITNQSTVNEIMKREKITLILNCAAYTQVDKAETEAALAMQINAKGPQNLARAAAKHDAKMIHISTDYVFSGHHDTPWRESDTPSPHSVYGQTKLDGEHAVLETAETAAIIRTSWLWSVYGKNFFNTMLALGVSRDELRVVYDQIGTPTYAPNLADVMLKLADSLQKGEREIFHFSNEGVCSWYDFAHEIMSVNKLKCRILPILSQAYPTPAVRPHYSVLDKSKIKSRLNIQIPHWRDTLITNNQN